MILQVRIISDAVNEQAHEGGKDGESDTGRLTDDPQEGVGEEVVVIEEVHDPGKVAKGE